jgi:hypothetical protein
MERGLYRPRRQAQKEDTNRQTGARVWRLVPGYGAVVRTTILRSEGGNGREDAIRRNSSNTLQILTHVGVRIVLCTVRPHHDMKLWACS